MDNYNKVIRRTVARNIDKCMQMTGLPLTTCLDIYVNNYYALCNSSNVHDKVYLSMLNSVLYLDTYKMLVYKQKEGMLNDEELDYFRMVINSVDYDDITTDYSSDIGYLKYSIKSLYEFQNLSGFAKINLVKSLGDNENEFLLDKIELHKFDLDTYGREITLEDIIKNMKNQYKYQQKLNGEVCLDSIAVSVLGFIKNMIKNDYDNAYKILLEIGKSDYEINKLINTKKEDDDILDHIDLYENYSQEDIVSFLESNESFLITAIWAILESNVLNKYQDVTIDNYKMDDDNPVMKKFILH